MTHPSSTLWTGLRNALIAGIALTLFAMLATGLLAALGASLSESHVHWLGLSLPDPWGFLCWAWGMLPTRPDIALLCLALLSVFILAALGVLAITAAIPPFRMPAPRLPGFPRRGFERWDIVRQWRTLRGGGLALGAVRCRPWAKPEPVTLLRGNVLVLGDAAATGEALLAMIAAWPGALVLVETGGLAARLPRQNMLRFAPGRPDSLQYNPLLAIRGASHAWADAKTFAGAWLETRYEPTIHAFAVLILDQLLVAPPDQRHLAALRRRLADRRRVFSEICATWTPSMLQADPPHSDIARAVASWRAAPHATLDALAHIDHALHLCADGAYADATGNHQLCLADLVIGEQPGALVINPPAGESARAAPLVSVMLAQLVAHCAAAPDIDRFGRPRTFDLLIVLDAEMTSTLRFVLPRLVPSHAAGNGCSLLVAAHAIEEAPKLANPAHGFDAVAAIGPQTPETAASLSRLGGAVHFWRREPASWSALRDLMLPAWSREERPAIAPHELLCARPDATLLLLEGLRPIEAKALAAPSAVAGFAAPEALPKVAHDWTAPSLTGAVTQPPEFAAQEVDGAQPTTGPVAKPISTRIRKALAGPIQRPLPLPKSKPPTTKKPT